MDSPLILRGLLHRAPVLLLLLLLSVLTFATAEEAFPLSFVLLPLSSFDNSSLIAAFQCSFLYGPSPCSGHGDCFVLLDSALASSDLLLNASSAPPLSIASLQAEALNPHDFSSFDALPTGVCVCHSGWTGRGDFINHLALDGDSCGVHQQTVVVLCSASLTFCIPLLLLCLQRLYCWYLWASEASESRKGLLAPRLSSLSLDGSSGQVEAVGGGKPGLTPRLQRPSRSQSTNRRRRWDDIALVHPLCSLLVVACLITHLSFRIWTDATVGTWWLMGALMYAHHIPCCIALCANALTRLRLVAAFARTRLNAGSFSRCCSAGSREATSS